MALAVATAVVVLLAQAPESRRAPPWGFVGSWQDYCYRRLPGSPHHYTSEPVFGGHRCGRGSTRFTTTQQIRLTARAGATIDRLGVFWGAVEPRPPVRRGGRRVHTYKWGRVTRLYGAMLDAGISPVVLASGTPEWARRPGWRRPGVCGARHGKACSYPPSRRHLNDWRAFIQALMRRLPQMLALEVWNEPNLPRFFAPRPSPPLYSQLLGAVDRAARISGDPVTVLTGGLTAGASRAHGGIPAARFLTRIYQLADQAWFDGISAHPYPQRRPWVGSMTANLDQLRRVRDRFDDRTTPLWITEVGVGGTSARGREGSVSLERQGPILARMYRSTQRGDVGGLLFYALRDSPTEGPKFEPFGVVRANLRPKPAYCHLASRLGGDSACGGEP